MTTTARVRIAAVADLHCRLGRKDNFQRLVKAVNEQSVDLVLLGGDLTDQGRPEEARLLADSLADLHAPIVAVLGNHDLDSGKRDEVVEILQEGRIQVLDGDRYKRKGGLVGVAGVKGFAGGFGRTQLQPFGEEAIKAFVMETINESLALEGALSRVDAVLKIALTHYAPIVETCRGESPEIMAFLGSSKLGEAIDAQEVMVAFHGHAHHGTLRGRTPDGRPVFNVALPVLRRIHPDRRALVVDLPLPEGVEREPIPPIVESSAIEYVSLADPEGLQA